MIKFKKPENLNGQQLKNELSAAGIVLEDYPILDNNGDLILMIKNGDAQEAEKIVNLHIGIDIEPSIEDKLASVGLTIDELKVALS